MECRKRCGDSSEGCPSPKKFAKGSGTAEVEADLLVVLGHSRDDMEKASGGLGLALIAADQGKKVEIHLLFDGVVMAVEKEAEAMLPGGAHPSPLSEKLDALAAKGVSVTVCTTCLKHRDLLERPLRAGCTRVTAVDFLASLDRAKRSVQLL
eukprot:RCo030552